MAKLLMVYATKEGQTAKIADNMAQQFRELGVTVDIYDARNLPKDLKLKDYNAFIAGGPVHGRKFPRPLKRWVQKHAAELRDLPSAFFSVSLGILQKNNARVQNDERQICEDFFAQTGWRPETIELVAGALPYTKYNWLIRAVMKSIARRAGSDIDTSRDFEYTDWDQVRNFAQQFASQTHLR